MNNYESIIILNADLEQTEIDGDVEKVQNLITNNGKLESTEIWGKRKLAYPIQKKSEGYYVLFNFSSESSFIDELNRVYSITDNIIKHIIVKKD